MKWGISGVPYFFFIRSEESIWLSGAIGHTKDSHISPRRFKVIEPGVTEPVVMLHTTTFAVFAVAKVLICNAPVLYPVTPAGELAKLQWTTPAVVRPGMFALCAAPQVFAGIAEVDSAKVVPGVEIKPGKVAIKGDAHDRLKSCLVPVMS